MSYIPNPVIATGSTTSRALADRLSDSLNAKDFGVTANGVNITGGATGFDVGVSAIGSDADVTLNLISKGTGAVQLQAGGSNIIVALPGGASLGTVTGTLGFYSTGGAVNPTITGAKGGNAALGSLLTALSSLGLITDSTT